MRKKLLIFSITAVVVVILDQLTKWFAQHIEAGQTISIIKGILEIGHYTNYGASFGMLQGKTLFLIMFSAAVLFMIIYYYRRIPGKYELCVAMIFGGTTGNLIDRLARGHVVDFINFAYWPAFNIADIAVTLGSILLIIMLIRDKQDRTIIIKPKKRKKNKFKKKAFMA